MSALTVFATAATLLVVGTAPVDAEAVSGPVTRDGPTAERVSLFDMAAARDEILRGRSLHVDPSSTARRQVAEWRRSRPSDADLLAREIASQPTGLWFGDWNRDIRGDVSRVLADAAKQSAVPLLVAYNIPQRDCGNHSSGGANGADGYRKWIRDFAHGLAGRPAVVIVEPDALASTKCLSTAERDERFSLLKYAVEVLKAEDAFVYLAAGHANWLSASDAAARLAQAGVALADGFALNVSNFVSNSTNIGYGNDISERVGGKHYVIDSSRNGAGGNGEWCNPGGRALGTRPTTRTAHAKLDAFLWVKKPGESDGSCNGGPGAGKWWGEYALQMAQRSTPVMAVADAAG